MSKFINYYLNLYEIIFMLLFIIMDYCNSPYLKFPMQFMVKVICSIFVHIIHIAPSIVQLNVIK